MRTLLRLLGHLNPATLVLAATRWLRRMLAMLRELRTHERRILAAKDVVANELRRNGYALDRSVSLRVSWAEVREQISTKHWDQSRDDLAIFRKRHPGLWRDLVRAYGELESIAAKATSTDYLQTAYLYDLATRLEKAEL